MKKAPAGWSGLKLLSLRGLLADAELFLSDNGTVACDVLAHEVVKETTTLAYKHFKSALCCMIFVI